MWFTTHVVAFVCNDIALIFYFACNTIGNIAASSKHGCNNLTNCNNNFFILF